MAPEVYWIAHYFPVSALITCYLRGWGGGEGGREILKDPVNITLLFGPRSDSIKTGQKSKTERVKTSPLLLLKLILKNCEL